MEGTGNISQNNTITFNGLNLKGLMLAIQIQLNGMQASICISSEIDTNTFREVTRLFPLRKRKILELKQELEFFHELATMFPALFLQRRVVEFANSIPGKPFIILADSYLKNDHENASYLMKTSKTEGFESFHWFDKGLLTREFAFDRSRLMIELLKYFRSIGGEITETQQDFNSSFYCSKLYSDNSFVKIEKPLSYSSDIIVHDTDGSFSIQTENGDKYLQTQGVLNDNVVKMVSDITGIDVSAFQISDVEESDQTLSDVSLHTLRQSVTLSLQQFSTKIDEQFNVKPLTSLSLSMSDVFRSSNIDRENCYDLAKETGIQYRDFIEYFHKYGKEGIHQIIENIYTLMGSYRDTQILWEQAEKQYLRTEIDMIFNRG